MTWYCFDHIGDVSLPPALFEKYLAAAEKIIHGCCVRGKLSTVRSAGICRERCSHCISSRTGASGEYGRADCAGGGTAGDAGDGGGLRRHRPMFGLVIPASKTPKRLALKLDGQGGPVLDHQETKTETAPGPIAYPGGKHTVGVAWVGSPQPDQGRAIQSRRRRWSLNTSTCKGRSTPVPALSEQLFLVLPEPGE